MYFFHEQQYLYIELIMTFFHLIYLLHNNYQYLFKEKEWNIYFIRVDLLWIEYSHLTGISICQN